MKKVGYHDDPNKAYTDAISTADSVAELVEAIKPFEAIAWDALDDARKLSDLDFAEFQRGLATERRGKFAGDAWAERFQNISMPEIMFRTSFYAAQFKVPFGVAYNQAIAAGVFKVGRKRVKYVGP